MFGKIVQAVKTVAHKVAEKAQALVVAGATALGLSVGAPIEVHAALPTGVDTAIAGIQTDASSLVDIVAPVMIAVLGMAIVLKLVKRFGNKI